MFYEGIGKLLAETATILAAGDSAADEKARRAQRGLTTLLRRVGAAWPGILGALVEETAVFEATLERARAAASRQGLEVPAEAASSDPLAHYGALQRELQAHILGFHAAGGSDASTEALRDIRRGMAEAAEIQGVVVEKMLAS